MRVEIVGLEAAPPTFKEMGVTIGRWGPKAHQMDQMFKMRGVFLERGRASKDAGSVLPDGKRRKIITSRTDPLIMAHHGAEMWKTGLKQNKAWLETRVRYLQGEIVSPFTDETNRNRAERSLDEAYKDLQRVNTDFQAAVARVKETDLALPVWLQGHG